MRTPNAGLEDLQIQEEHLRLDTVFPDMQREAMITLSSLAAASLLCFGVTAAILLK
jgi:hypothetical protein